MGQEVRRCDHTVKSIVCRNKKLNPEFPKLIGTVNQVEREKAKRAVAAKARQAKDRQRARRKQRQPRHAQRPPRQLLQQRRKICLRTTRAPTRVALVWRSMCIGQAPVHEQPADTRAATSGAAKRRKAAEAQKAAANPPSLRELILLVLPKMGPTFHRSMLRAKVKTIDPVASREAAAVVPWDKNEWKAVLGCRVSCRRRASSPTMSRGETSRRDPITMSPQS